MRFTGLDGLRAISVLLVILFHLKESGHPVGWVGNHGIFGVSVFFVISGFLITSLLLRGFDLKSFYLRRAKRILPPAFFYLLCVSPWLSWSDLGACLGFCRNSVNGSWLTNHFWSLSVEEQFYFLWPLVLVWTPSAWRTRLLVAAVLAAPIWQKVCWFYNPFRLDLTYAPLAIGCLFAVSGWRFPVWSGLVAIALGGFGSWFAVPRLCVWVQHLGVGIVVSGVSERTTWLDHPFLVAIGKWSYAIYLWQQPLCAKRP